MAKKAKIKFIIFGLFLAGAITLVFSPDVRSFLTHENIKNFLDESGQIAPIVYIGSYAIFIVLTLPGTVVTIVGATFFPLFKAFFLVLAGAMLGSSLSFGIGRLLGRDAIESFLGKDSPWIERLSVWVERFEQNGLMSVAYMRIAYVPFSILNYLAPLTGIRFRDFFLGTLIGILPGSFIFVFLGNALTEVWVNSDPSALYGWKSVVAILLFGASLLLPKALKKFIKQ